MDTSEPLPTRRWRLFLEQFAEDLGAGWQSELARRLGIHSTTISKYVAGTRKGAGLQTMTLAIEKMGISRDFFFDPALGAAPHYRNFMGKKRPAIAPVVPITDNPHWRRFVQMGVAEKLGLSEEQTQYVKGAVFRGGARSWLDYARVAEAIAAQELDEPAEMEAARKANPGAPKVDLDDFANERRKP